jgi:phosphoribosyl 1,2-cyclic phosphate phosphodiesterase
VRYRGTPEIALHTIDPEQTFTVDGVEITPIRGRHAHFEVTGYRFGDVAYMTDFKEIDDSELKKLYGVKVLVINALRYQPHDSHLSVAEALAIIEKVAPKRAYLTHMSHEIGLHALAEQRLPENVYFAYDKLKIEL